MQEIAWVRSEYPHPRPLSLRSAGEASTERCAGSVLMRQKSWYVIFGVWTPCFYIHHPASWKCVSHHCTVHYRSVSRRAMPDTTTVHGVDIGMVCWLCGPDRLYRNSVLSAPRIAMPLTINKRPPVPRNRLEGSHNSHELMNAICGCPGLYMTSTRSPI